MDENGYIFVQTPSVVSTLIEQKLSSFQPVINIKYRFKQDVCGKAVELCCATQIFGLKLSCRCGSIVFL